MQQIGGLVAEVIATQIGRFQRRRIDQLGLLVESGLENGSLWIPGWCATKARLEAH
jgi:hypothetical protein